LLRRLGGVPTPPSRETGFFFDPVYPDFLDEVARRVPPDATVAVLVPRSPDVYRYQAVYRLAPRRVVEEGQVAEAGFIAAYGPDSARFSGAPLPNGTLVRK
jgi:hypothetical protein